MLAVNPPEGVTLMAEARAGQFVTEISSDDFSALSGEALVAKLRETADSQQIEHRPQQVRPRRRHADS